MQACKVRRKKSCAATGCIFVCSMIHGLCRGEKMGGCVWLHISNTFFHHHHHQQPLARFVNHCAVKLFVKSNLIYFYVCLIWGLSTLVVLYNLEQKSSLHLNSNLKGCTEDDTAKLKLNVKYNKIVVCQQQQSHSLPSNRNNI